MGLLDRIFGRAKGEQRTPTEMTPKAAEKIVQDYGAVLGSAAPAPGCVADVRSLPHPKERIKQALVFALRITKEPQVREQLKIGYISLADWQEGVGSETVGMDLTKMDLSADPLEIAKRIASQGDAVKKWTHLVQAEQNALKSELQKLGLW
jgi:hypothetical protein